MNFGQTYSKALRQGIEYPPEEVKPPNAAEQKVLHIHNDWLAHQNTKQTLDNLHKEKTKLLNYAASLASINEPDDNKLRSALCKAKGLEIAITIITSYGQFNTDRDSATS